MHTSILLKKSALCETLGGVAPNYIDHLERTDPTFPRKLKFGNNKQSAVFYDSVEFETWLNSKRAARVQQSTIDGGAI